MGNWWRAVTQRVSVYSAVYSDFQRPYTAIFYTAIFYTASRLSPPPDLGDLCVPMALQKPLEMGFEVTHSG